MSGRPLVYEREMDRVIAEASANRHETVKIPKEILAKVLAKIRLPNELCCFCTSGMCVVCQAYKFLEVE